MDEEEDMSRQQPKSPHESTHPEVIWKDEMNLSELPLSTLTDRVSEGLTKLEFYITEADGETIRRVRVIPPGDDQLRELIEVAYPGLMPDSVSSPRRKKGEPEAVVELPAKVAKLLSSVRGLPSPMDEDVLLALIQLTRKNGFRNRRVNFSLYEVVKLLGWNDGAKSYTRVIVSLLRWKAVLLTYQDSWRDNEEKRFMTRTFNMLDEVTIYTSPGRRSREAVSGQSQLPFSSFLWSEAMFKSFEDGFLKDLDFRKYNRLNSRIAKRMYRFLDKCFGRLKTPSLVFELRDFACGHVGLSREYEPWKLKQVIAPALLELEANGIIVPQPPEKRYQTAGRGNIRVVFQPVKSMPALPERMAAAAVVVSPIVLSLEQHGVTRSTAESLVGEFSAESIQRQLEVLTWWLETEREPKIKEPGAWLCKAIRENYAFPKGYESKADRERKQQAMKDAMSRKKAEAAEKKRREQAEADEIIVRRRHIDTYLRTLSGADRQALEATAIAAGDDLEQRIIRLNEAGASMLYRILVEREVLRRCPLVAQLPSA